MQQRLRQAGKLVGRQIEFLRMAFQTGFRAASGRLQNGIESLRLFAATAMLLGTFGLVWTLMKGFDGAKEFSEVAPSVGAGLGFFAIALLVAAPAVIARIALRNVVRERKQELERFRDDIHRLFERTFAAALDPVRPVATPSRDTSAESEPAPQEKASPSERSAPAASLEPASDVREEPKRYHSIRDRLLRSETEEEESSPFRMNPIARQAAAVGGKSLRGY
jgi:hypothetical protein